MNKLLIIILMLLAGCTSGTDTPSSVPISADPPAASAVEPGAQPVYLDDRAGHGNKIQARLAAVINENAKALNAHDEKAYLATFSTEVNSARHLAKSGYDYLVGLKASIMKLDNPRFGEPRLNNNEIVVIVDRTMQDNSHPSGNKSGAMYIFKFINDQWELIFID